MNKIEKLMKQTISEYQDVFAKNIQALDNEIIADSPVRWGGFKTSWSLERFNKENFVYKRVNYSVYGLRLWRYHHSKQGWSPKTGDSVVSRHTENLRRDFEKINKKVIQDLK